MCRDEGSNTRSDTTDYQEISSVKMAENEYTSITNIAFEQPCQTERGSSTDYQRIIRT